ncbi:MAG: MBL fold metallo-hydrolase [Endomicrobium sp.]|jgi:ribonuclease J|nr:MBL fold metallo-hydrolase [Endomicrobium sp.]
MEIKFYSGTNQIGASCFEVRSQGGGRILFDYGKPLDSVGAAPQLDDCNMIDGVFISHPHQDHYGFINELPKQIPFYMSETGSKLIKLSQRLSSAAHKAYDNKTIFLNSGKSVKVKDIEIIPFMADHSAIGALSFLIKADGKSIFYSADFRFTGRKPYTSSTLEQYFEKHKEKIDYLILEGTHIEKENASPKTEEQLEKEIVDFLKKPDKLTFVYASGQNIDRFVTFYRAAIRTKKILVIDLYMAYILDTLNIPTLPKSQSNNILRFPYKEQVRQFKRAKLSEYTDKFLKTYTKKDKEINANPSKYIFLLRSSMLSGKNEFNEINVKNANLIYSMWAGYQNKDDYKKTIGNWIDKNNILKKDMHISGHADIEALKKLVDIVKPQNIIPFHTNNPETFKKHWDNVRIVKDKEILEV